MFRRPDFTVGKLAYDLIVTDKEISDTIQRIVQLRTEMSEVAQAAAMSKALIQLIEQFDKALLAVNSNLPQFSSMWAEQKQRVESTISSIRSGVDPKYMIDIGSMPGADATWNKLADFAQKLPLSIQQGKPVTITTTRKSMEASSR